MLEGEEMTEEDEEFNRIEREAKQRMEAVSAALDKKAENARELGLDYEPEQQEYERGFIDGMQEQMKRSVDRAVNAMAQRTWVGLTEADWKHLYDEFAMGQELDEFAEAIEAKLKEKNT
jgi:hypothetical protein